VLLDIETLLRMNIQELLKARRMKPAELARMLRRTNPWLSRIMNPPENKRERRSMRLPDIERVARVFGLAPHELLTPGIHRFTERRHVERRVTPTRRMNGERRRRDVKRFLDE
jgi:hypothetical protein